MNRHHRLRRAADIARVRTQGHTWASPNLVLLASEGQAAWSRIAFTVSARVGPAVVRNRIRRRLRAAFQPHLRRPDPPLDMVVIARKRLRDAPFTVVVEVVSDIMERCLAQQAKAVA